MQYKGCLQCKIKKPITEFGKDKYKQDGLRIYCKICSVRLTIQSRNKNKPYYQDYIKGYRDKNKDIE